MSRHTRPTFTSRVFLALQNANDFRTSRQLQAELGIGSRQVSASLHSLYRYHAVDVVEGEDALWWFATPEEDRRQVVRREITDAPIIRLRRPAPHQRRKARELPSRN